MDESFLIRPEDLVLKYVPVEPAKRALSYGNVGGVCA